MVARYARILPLVILVPACATAASPTASPIAAGSAPEPWRATAGEHRASVGERFDYECTPEGEANTVWGTDVYTDDSSVCTAAVHAGVITLEEGGTVTIEIQAGTDAYAGTTRNGIETMDYGPWGGSFMIVSPGS